MTLQLGASMSVGSPASAILGKGRTNLFTFPEDATNPIWLKSAVVVDQDAGYLTDLTKQGAISYSYDNWDLRVYSGIVVKGHDDKFRMFYTSYGSDVANDYGPAVAESDDLVTWIKPNVGIIDWPNGSGNVDNNLIIFRDDTTPTPLELADVIWDGTRYLALAHNKITAASQLWSSADAYTWSFVKNAFTGADLNGGEYAEPKSILYDGSTYKLYYRSDDGGVLQRRSLGYYESATYNGTYTDQGLLTEFTSIAETYQYYDIKVWESAGLWWASVALYDKTTEVLGPHILYQSADTGASWKDINTILLPNGSSGEFDDGLMAVGKPVLYNAAWHYIYVASSETHNVWPRPMVFAKAIANNSILHRMDRINMEDNNAAHYIAYNNVTTVSGENYKYAALVKANGANFITLSSVDAADNFISATFNLTTGEITQEDEGSVSGTIVASKAQAIYDDIWLVSIIGSHTGAGSTYVYLSPTEAGTFVANSVGLNSYDALDNKDVLVCGMTCEAL